MSGHSKWSQIKHKKAASDQKKSAIFGKLARAIIVTARDNPDPKTNLPLKTTIEKARSLNMPNENIERALKRVTDASRLQLEKLQLEALGPGNSALIITAITDNRNRTLQELKTLLAEYHARVVNPGSLSWMFSKQGSAFVAVTTTHLSPDDQQTLAGLLEALGDHEDVQDIFTNAS